MKNRRGASLIELMVVIAILTVILGLVGVLFQRLFRAELLSTRATVAEITTMRLADQFRRDIHAASAVEQAKPGADALPTLELKNTTHGSTILYTGGLNKVLRDVRQGGQTISHEVYRLPGCRISFPASLAEASENESKIPPSFITMSLERPQAGVTETVQAQSPFRAIVVDAELGRDQRLAATMSLPSGTEGNTQ